MAEVGAEDKVGRGIGAGSTANLLLHKLDLVSFLCVWRARRRAADVASSASFTSTVGHVQGFSKVAAAVLPLMVGTRGQHHHLARHLNDGAEGDAPAVQDIWRHPNRHVPGKLASSGLANPLLPPQLGSVSVEELLDDGCCRQLNDEPNFWRTSMQEVQGAEVVILDVNAERGPQCMPTEIEKGRVAPGNNRRYAAELANGNGWKRACVNVIVLAE